MTIILTTAEMRSNRTIPIPGPIGGARRKMGGIPSWTSLIPKQNLGLRCIYMTSDDGIERGRYNRPNLVFA